MGMDVYGKNPKQNKPKEEFPVYYKFDKMEFKDKWKELDKDEKLKEEYWKEQTDYEDVNVGHYFRNNCWWWRPLWNYCYHIADDLISKELFDSGHHNDGSGLNNKDAKLLGNRLLQQIREGKTIKYQAEYQQQQNDSDDEFSTSYPFDIDNVKAFAEFCIQSGGFEIC